jgi:hypothetical protein
VERGPYIPTRDLVYEPPQLIIDRAEGFHRNAVCLLDYLCLPEFDEPAKPDTYRALSAWQDMEDRAWEVHDTSQTCAPVDALRRHFILFHVALPFEEAERAYLIENIAFDGKRPTETDDMLRHEARIVSRGIHKIIVGHELIRRWLAWRQQIDEYSGQGTLDQARIALAYITKNVRRYTPLPESYINLGLEIPGVGPVKP